MIDICKYSERCRIYKDERNVEYRVLICHGVNNTRCEQYRLFEHDPDIHRFDTDYDVHRKD